ncbi:MAG TPA: hypothetical protein VGG58_08230 [Candidatus Acidoferrum sp.]|jgi:DNA-binding CsgD family transcriptional regulator
MKSVEFKQAVLAGATQADSNAVVASAGQGMMPARGMELKAATAAPRFTAEETILLRGLASGSTAKEMAMQMRLQRESLYRLMGDLRPKTGASSDTALAVWVLRNMGSGGADRSGGGL